MKHITFNRNELDQLKKAGWDVIEGDFTAHSEYFKIVKTDKGFLVEEWVEDPDQGDYWTEKGLYDELEFATDWA
jgi:hypothetical protein